MPPRRVFLTILIANAIAVAVTFATPAYAVQHNVDAVASETYAAHTSHDMTPASEKTYFFIEDKAVIARSWSAKISAQAWYDGVYSSQSAYPQTLRDEDSIDTRVQDFYLQKKTANWLIRVGNQQVVWGETFGVSPADLVNPRDYRFGVPINASDSRLSSPMVNAKYLAESFSAQFLYLAQPKFDILPLPGSDYLPRLDKRTHATEVRVHRQTELPWEVENSAFGLRLSKVIGNADLSGFYLNHFSSSPYYSRSEDTKLPQLLVVDEHHSRVASTGATLASDLNGYILRAEGVFTANERVSTYHADTLAEVTTSEVATALSLDFPTWSNLNTSVQWSQATLGNEDYYVIRKSKTAYLSGHALYTFTDHGALESVITYAAHDGGFRVLEDYVHPWFQSVDTHFGIDYFTGSVRSDFGRIARASRIYLRADYRF
jgi:hypothetical protein